MSCDDCCDGKGYGKVKGKPLPKRQALWYSGQEKYRLCEEHMKEFQKQAVFENVAVFDDKKNFIWIYYPELHKKLMKITKPAKELVGCEKK